MQGVKDYEPQVVQQLLDCMYRHISDILQDAEVSSPLELSSPATSVHLSYLVEDLIWVIQAYRQRMINPAGEISLEDLLLAIQARETHTFMQLPPQSVSLWNENFDNTCSILVALALDMQVHP